MVNGPRPSTIVSPAAARSATPTVLSRQHTSIYSTTSANTPVLVYGKDITPLQGNWADEPWMSPKERAATQTVQLSEMLDAPISAEPAIVDDNSSVSGETAAYVERPAVIPQPRDAAVDMFRMPSDGSDGAVSNTQTNATSGHVSFVFRYDPYSTSNRTEIYRCQCDDCIDRAQAVTGVDFLSAAVYAQSTSASSYAPMMMRSPQYEEPSPAMSMGHPVNSYDTAAYDTTYSQTAMDHDDALWTSTNNVAMNVPEIPRTSFMPPPPPPRITRRVISESAEPSLDAESAYYLIIMRWYHKAAAAQSDWVRNDDRCPEPDFGEKYTFDEWVDEIGRWWLRNFEHVQVKTSASSGAIRAATARPAALPRSAGFETHASVGARLAQPRRSNGTSGLTAEMLESHNQNVAPSSHMRARRELPW